jgi:hypothetical protein
MNSSNSAIFSASTFVLPWLFELVNGCSFHLLACMVQPRFSCLPTFPLYTIPCIPYFIYPARFTFLAFPFSSTPCLPPSLSRPLFLIFPFSPSLALYPFLPFLFSILPTFSVLPLSFSPTSLPFQHSLCSLSRWRPQKVDKRMVLEYTHGLFIT